MIFDRIRSLARHTAVYGIGDFLGKAVGVLLVPLYARLLTPEDNGVIALAFAFIGFSAVFYSLGLNQALIRYLSSGGDEDHNRTRFSSAFWFLLVFALVLSSAVWSGAESLSRIFLASGEHADIFRMIAAIVLMDSLSEPLFTLLRARQRSTHFTVVRLVQHTLQLSLTAYLLAFQGYGPNAIFVSNLASSGIALLALLPMGIRNLRFSLSPRTVRELLAFGIPFVPSAVSLLVINLSDRFLMRLLLGVEEVGIFTIVYKICLPMHLVVKVFRSAWAPSVLSIPEREEALQVVSRVATYYLMAATLVYLVLTAFSVEIIHLIAGQNAEQYLLGKGVVPLVTLAFVLSGIYIILTAGVYSEGRSGMLPWVVGTGALANLLVNVILLPRIGLIGAAWSTLVAYGLMCLLLFVSVRRFYDVAYEYGRLAKVVISGTVAYIAISSYATDVTLQGSITRGILILVYPLILWGWRFFEPNEMRNLGSLLGWGAALPTKEKNG